MILHLNYLTHLEKTLNNLKSMLARKLDVEGHNVMVTKTIIIVRIKKATNIGCFFLLSYFLLTVSIYFFNAIVIDGVSGVGAAISTRKPLASTALIVVLPKTAILVSFCLKSGKL